MDFELFPKDAKEAIYLQKKMASRVVLQDDLPCQIRSIAGVDVSNTPFDPNQMIYGSIIRFSYPDLCEEERVCDYMKQSFPYISGLLGFRESPVLVSSFKCLKTRPDILLVDGHGICHPRALGIASHLGILLDIPTIGVGKTILTGKPKGRLGEEVGSKVELEFKGKTVGMLVRTKRKCAPLIVSIGHKICLDTAVDLVLSCVRKHRLIEPTRQAHLAANAYRAEGLVFNK
jgi:deoxyribonuclease V